MQYDPIKKSLGNFFSGSLLMRKIFFILLDLLLLRTWHVKKALKKMVHKYPGRANVLDAGAGFGQYTWRISRMNREWHIKSVDIDTILIDDNRLFFDRTGLSGRVVCDVMDLTKLSDNETFDLILSVDVMEHIQDDQLVFSNFSRALKKGGSLLISTPSDKGGSDVHGSEGQSFIDEHVRDGYGTEEITGKLTKAGFRNISVRYTYGKPGNISWRLSMKYPVQMLSISRLFYFILPLWYMITFPVSMILNLLDINIIHKTGTGLLVSATK